MTTTGLALTLGKSKEHAVTAIQRFNPDLLILITSEDLASITKRRLTLWKKQFDLDGAVFVIKDLFTDAGAENIMTQTFLALDALKAADCDQIYLGVTGGTMHMAAVATSAATMSGVPVFYVKQPDGKQVVQPNKDVLMMPNINAFRAIRNLPVEVIDYFRSLVIDKQGEQKGLLTDDEAEKLGIPPHIIAFLHHMGIFESVDEETHKLTYAGWTVVKLVRKSPNLDRMLAMLENNSSEQNDHMFG
jgi:hypothetical protein